MDVGKEKQRYLNSLRVAAPCHVDWDSMTGDEKTRFCASCAKHVYNLSEMTVDEAYWLVSQKEGKTCVRFYRRRDGNVITDNCPVGLRAVRSRLRRIGGGIAALVSFLIGGSAMRADAVDPHWQESLQGDVCPPANLFDPLQSETFKNEMANDVFNQLAVHLKVNRDVKSMVLTMTFSDAGKLIGPQI